MELREGVVYSCGKNMCRKIIKLDGDYAIFAKCHESTKYGMYVIGAGVHNNIRILQSSFKKWAKEVVQAK